MTAITAPVLSATAENGHVRVRRGANSTVVHALWLRNATQEPGQIEATNRQRLFTPLDVPLDLSIVGCRDDGDRFAVTFSDGHTAHIDAMAIARALGWESDPEEPLAPEAWAVPIDPLPYVDWSAIGWSTADEDTDAVIAFLDAFARHGFVVLRGTPTEPGTVRRICDRLGYVTGNNFGWVFDVRAEERPTDLAYTPIGLLAHTDQPYRRPVPGIQLLHCLRNDAPGGDSTLVDGLAAANALAATDADAHRAAIETRVEWRYDMGTDTVVGHGHLIERDREGTFRSIHLNTKLDTAMLMRASGRGEAQHAVDLTAWYRARLSLMVWCNDPAHQVTFRLEPGDVMFMDNLRVLHGRTPFDPTRGARHLQGAYIDHDGPDTMYRLAKRRVAGGGS